MLSAKLSEILLPCFSQSSKQIMDNNRKQLGLKNKPQMMSAKFWESKKFKKSIKPTIRKADMLEGDIHAAVYVVAKITSPLLLYTHIRYFMVPYVGPYVCVQFWTATTTFPAPPTITFIFGQKFVRAICTLKNDFFALIMVEWTNLCRKKAPATSSTTPKIVMSKYVVFYSKTDQWINNLWFMLLCWNKLFFTPYAF